MQRRQSALPANTSPPQRRSALVAVMRAPSFPNSAHRQATQCLTRTHATYEALALQASTLAAKCLHGVQVTGRSWAAHADRGLFHAHAQAPEGSWLITRPPVWLTPAQAPSPCCLRQAAPPRRRIQARSCRRSALAPQLRPPCWSCTSSRLPHPPAAPSGLGALDLALHPCAKGSLGGTHKTLCACANGRCSSRFLPQRPPLRRWPSARALRSGSKRRPALPSKSASHRPSRAAAAAPASAAAGSDRRLPARCASP